MALAALHRMIDGMRQPQPYSLGTSEVRGMGNLVLGSFHLVASRCLKLHPSPEYRNILAERLVEIGFESLWQGLCDLRSVLYIAGTCSAAQWTWVQLSPISE